ncbi:MAG TPA: lysophospholipid acyltransferase family protein [Planctomycetota bacterium]|nr:lysophospholipid acyltransferase family protein [Planctomycetota bacterium]
MVRLGCWALLGLNALCRVRLLQLPYAERRRRGERARCLYALWHGDLWHAIYAMRRQEITVLVSTHRDGELIARVIARLGFGLVRGSSTRGGAHALREIARVAREEPGDLGFTIDGPRGPARRTKDGILYAASRAGLPIVPVGVWIDRAWQAKSWDRLRIGKPFTRVCVALGDELRIPADVEHRELLPRFGPQLEAAMATAESRAREGLC